MALFTKQYRNVFKAETGAFSPVTDREATGDKSVTVDQFEKVVLSEKYSLDTFTRKGGSLPDGKSTDHSFNVIDVKTDTYSLQQLAVTYPKAIGAELRLYFRHGTGFYPLVNSMWFIFTRAGVSEPFIGVLTLDEWENLTAGIQFAQNFEKDYGVDSEDDAYQKAINSPKAQKGAVEVTVTKNVRDAVLAAKILSDRGYACQYNVVHETFISASTGNRYVEAHHLIPVSKTVDFEHSLDVEANIISLCPNCHRTIHYATAQEKKPLLDRFFNECVNGLVQSGLNISLEQLYAYYGIDD